MDHGTGTVHVGRYSLRMGDGFECAGGWCGDPIAYGGSGGGGGVSRGDEGRLDSGGAGAATVAVVAMDGEMGSPNAGVFMTEWMVVGSKKVVPHDHDSKCGL